MEKAGQKHTDTTYYSGSDAGFVTVCERVPQMLLIFLYGLPS